ncbi:MAG: TolC family protein [Thermodesulfovibrionales bacterium]|nr:TolC family protein [Thermodesulfovibrionales bacterium]
MRLKIFALALILVAIVPYRTEAQSSERKSTFEQFIESIDSSDYQDSNHKESKGQLTLKQAIHMALSKNPELTSYSLEIQAREAQIPQSKLLPNPEIEIEVENFYGNKNLRGFGGAESSLSVSQTIELGGKRLKRGKVSSLERDMANWDYTAKRQDVVTDVIISFIDVLAEQERLVIIEELVRLAEQSLNTASAMVQAGKVSPIDEMKAKASLSSAQIELKRANRSLDAARKRLAALLGEPAPAFARAAGKLEAEASIPAFDELYPNISANPDIARWTTEKEQRTAILNLERANRIYDPAVRFGLRRFHDTDETAFTAGITIPLPFFNRNQGGIKQAAIRQAKAQNERKAAELKTSASLSEAYAMLSSSFEEWTSLKSDILPQLQSAYDAISEGYRYGKFGYLDVLDTQRTLFESNIRYIDALVSYKKAFAGVYRLIGGGELKMTEAEKGEKDER